MLHIKLGFDSWAVIFKKSGDFLKGCCFFITIVLLTSSVYLKAMFL